MLVSVKEKINDADNIALTIDFWSKNVTGYIGITGTIYCKEAKSLKTLCLCLEQVPYPHTAEKCLEATNLNLEKFGLNVMDPKISFITTDNGSNMKKAYSKLKTFSLDATTFDFDPEVTEKEMDSFLPVAIDKRLQCVAHSLNNSLQASVNGSKKYKLEPCTQTKEMLTKALEIAKKVIH